VITTRALARLRAPIDVVAKTPPVKEIEHLKQAMSLMMGKGMKIKEDQDAGHRVITFYPSSTSQDVSKLDMERISRALLDSKSLLTIHVEDGRPVFSFEIMA
jgi:hypothetical protein